MTGSGTRDCRPEYMRLGHGLEECAIVCVPGLSMRRVVNLAEVTSALEGALSVQGITPLRTGGQKAVFACELAGQAAIAKVVALPNGPDLLNVFERAQREVEILATIDSPRVVRVLTEVVELPAADGTPLALAWLEERLSGEDLATRFISNWPFEDARRLMGDIALGLLAFHELDVVHRDLSPNNVRALEDGRFTVMDPGLARHLSKTALTGLYQPGTPGYRSPEHVPGGDIQPVSDIYCAGILVFQALTGNVPLDPSPPEDAYFVRLRTLDPPKLAPLRPDLPSEFCGIVDQCLMRQPARRFLDAKELLAEMDHAGLA